MSIVSCKCCFLLQDAKSMLSVIELMMAFETVESAEFIKIADYTQIFVGLKIWLSLADQFLRISH